MWTAHAGTWTDTAPAIREEAVSLASWLWRCGTVYGAIHGGLVKVCSLSGGGQRVRPQQALTLTDIESARKRTRVWPKSKEAERDQLYRTLAQTDAPRADAYLSSLLRTRPHGLVECIEDPARPGKYLTGPGVVDGAAEYIEQRLAERKSTRLVDEGYRRRTVAECAQAARGFTCANWHASHRPYTVKGWNAAMRKLKIGKCCADLTPAAVIDGAPGQAKFGLAVRNLERRLHSISPQLKRQPVYYQAKANRARMELQSYRTLSPNALELGIAEILWGGRNTDAPWDAAGPWQLGRMDCLLAAWMDVDSALIRSSLDLPLAIMHVDLEEAHDTVLCEEFISRAHHSARIQGKDLGLGAAFVLKSSVQVHSGRYKSRVVNLRIVFFLDPLAVAISPT